ADNSLIVGFTYTYDRRDNKLTEENLLAPNDSELYHYDSASRLLSFQRGTLNAAKDGIAVPSSHVPSQSNWTLDGAGNWNKVDGETREHASFNEITRRDAGFIASDDNGNEFDDGTFTYTWDFQNRLRSVTRKSDGALVAVYSYDAAGRRIRKVVTNADA